MRITVDTDYLEGTIILVPDQFLDPQQTRELFNAFREKKIIILPPGRILSKEGIKAIPFPDKERF